MFFALYYFSVYFFQDNTTQQARPASCRSSLFSCHSLLWPAAAGLRPHAVRPSAAHCLNTFLVDVWPSPTALASGHWPYATRCLAVGRPLPEEIFDRCLAIGDLWRNLAVARRCQRILAHSVPPVEHLGSVVVEQLPPIKQSSGGGASPLMNGSRKEVLPGNEAIGRRARTGGHEQGGGKAELLWASVDVVPMS